MISHCPARMISYLFGILMPGALAMFALSGCAAAAENPVHHVLVVVIEPAAGNIRVMDDINLRAPAAEIRFTLNAALELRSDGIGVIVIELGPAGSSAGLNRHRMVLAPPRAKLNLTYAGILSGEEFSEQGYSRGAHIRTEGVFLSAAAGWYPQVENGLHAFSLAVTVLAGWEAISQGVRIESADGSSDHRILRGETQPQDDLYLIAGPSHRAHLQCSCLARNSRGRTE